MLIGDNPGCRLTELSEAMGSRSSNLVNLVDLAVRRGHVLRREDPDVRTNKRLTLSDSGALFLRQLSALHDEHAMRVGAAFEDGEVEELLRLLRKLKVLARDDAR